MCTCVYITWCLLYFLLNSLHLREIVSTISFCLLLKLHSETSVISGSLASIENACLLILFLPIVCSQHWLTISNSCRIQLHHLITCYNNVLLSGCKLCFSTSSTPQVWFCSLGTIFVLLFIADVVSRWLQWKYPGSFAWYCWQPKPNSY